MRFAEAVKIQIVDLPWESGIILRSLLQADTMQKTVQENSDQRWTMASGRT